MSENSSKASASGNRQELEQTLACVEQMIRDFENLTGRFRMANAGLPSVAGHAQAPGNASATSPGGHPFGSDFRELDESLIRQKALAKEMIDAASAYTQELVRWAEAIEKREQKYGNSGAGQQNAADSAEGRAVEAARLEQQARFYSENAKDENRAADLALAEFGLGEEYERRKIAVKAWQDAAGEMQRRAYILTNGNEGDYRQLMLNQYGVNNPDLDSIASYFAKSFNDQETLNWLSHQHPASPPKFDLDGVAMMLLPEAAGVEEGAEKAAIINDPPPPPNYNAIEYLPETSRMMDENAAAYQDGAPASRYGMAPSLSGVDLNGWITVKFDGVDAATGEMVDRKLNVVDRPNFIKAALRQSAVAPQNGFTVRWEVPNEAVQAKAQRILSTNGIKNIKVVVVPQ